MAPKVSQNKKSKNLTNQGEVAEKPILKVKTPIKLPTEMDAAEEQEAQDLYDNNNLGDFIIDDIPQKRSALKIPAHIAQYIDDEAQEDDSEEEDEGEEDDSEEEDEGEEDDVVSVPEKTKLIKKDKSPLVQINKPVPPRSQTHPQRQQVVPQKIAKKQTQRQQPVQVAQQQSVQSSENPVYSLTAQQIDELLKQRLAQLGGGIQILSNGKSDSRFDNEDRCRDCVAIFKAVPTNDKTQVSENKFQVGLEKAGKGSFIKVYGSIPCKPCQTEMIRSLENVVRSLLDYAKSEEGNSNPYNAYMLSYFTPILPYFSVGRSLEEATKLRMTLDSNPMGINKGISMSQHFSYTQEGWSISTDYSLSSLEVHDTIAQKLFPDYVFDQTVSDMICQALGTNFVPPKTLKVPKSLEIEIKDLTF